MNLDRLLEGIYQIRVPDHIIHELMVDFDVSQHEMVVAEPAPMTDQSSLTDKKTAADDYKQSLGEMQMI